jgi:hypothetical protein
MYPNATNGKYYPIPGRLMGTPYGYPSPTITAEEFAIVAKAYGLAGDWNGDGKVDVTDLNAVLATYGKPGGTTVFDLNKVLGNYGKHS